MKIKLRHLRLVQAIHRAGNISRAANRLRVTQPAVSQGLRELEEWFALKLFERSSTGMRPTEAGQRLCDTAERVLRLVEQAHYDLEQLGAGLRGVLRVTTECYTCYHWLPEILEQFRTSWPGFEVRIVPEAKKNPREALRRRELDLAITHTRDNGADLEAIALFEDELVAVVSPKHPLATRRFLEPQDFATQDLILHSDPRNSLLYLGFLLPAGVEPRHVSILQLTEAVIAAVRAGLGISVLARWAVGPDLQAGKLVALRLGQQGFHRQWSATVLSALREHPPVAALIELLQSASSISMPELAARKDTASIF